MENLEQLEKKYKELGEEIERIKKNKRWIPRIGEKYYFMDSAQMIQSMTNTGTLTDETRIRLHNCFCAKEDAEKAIRKINTYFKIKEIADRLNAKNPINWDKIGQAKYYIFFDKKTEDFYTDYNTHCQALKTYCTDSGFVKVVKEEICRKDLLELFDVEE